MPTFLIPLPNVIIFQFNPETMTHTWSPPEAMQTGEGGNPLAVKGNPGETFSFSLAMDSGDMIADGSPVAQGIAELSGIYTRLAALEMLLYPVPAKPGGLLGSVSVSIGPGGVSASAGASSTQKTEVPKLQVPTVLFVWGPGRILPV